MSPRKGDAVVCQVGGKPHSLRDMISGRTLRSAIADRIRADHPDWKESSYICSRDLNRYRSLCVALESEKGELSKSEIRRLNAKVDLMLTQQRHRLLEIQEV